MVRRLSFLIASTSLVTALAGCSFQTPDLEPGLRCGGDGSCPTGQSCVIGVCSMPGDSDAMAGGEDAGTDPDADNEVLSADASVPDAETGCTATACPAADLVDDFSTGGIGPLWFTWNSPTACVISETGGTVRMAFPGTGTSQYCGIDAEAPVDLRSSAIFIDAAGAASATTFTTFFQLSDPATFNNRVELYREQGTLYAKQVIGGNPAAAQSQAYSASAHRYWRMRGAAGRVYFETSANAVAWTPWFDTAAQLDLSELVVTLGAGHYQNPGGPVVTSIAGVNVP